MVTIVNDPTIEQLVVAAPAAAMTTHEYLFGSPSTVRMHGTSGVRFNTKLEACNCLVAGWAVEDPDVDAGAGEHVPALQMPPVHVAPSFCCSAQVDVPLHAYVVHWVLVHVMGWPLQTALPSHVSLYVHGLPSKHDAPTAGVCPAQFPWPSQVPPVQQSPAECGHAVPLATGVEVQAHVELMQPTCPWTQQLPSETHGGVATETCSTPSKHVTAPIAVSARKTFPPVLLIFMDGPLPVPRAPPSPMDGSSAVSL
jgi:hypothetical protein